MTTAVTTPTDVPLVYPWSVDTSDPPWLYEDEDEMGDSDRHFTMMSVLCFCLRAFLATRHRLMRAFANMNLYYAPPVAGMEHRGPPYVSPDIMVVKPIRDLGDNVTSYFLFRDGPAPLVSIEVLSESTARQGDLTTKMTLYARMRVPEYILIDWTARFLPERLLLKRLQPDGSWRDEQDADGGVTSELGFRLTIDEDDNLRVVDAVTGQVFIRPDEAQVAENARRKAERARRQEQQAREKAEAEQQVEREARLRLEQELRDALARLRELEQK